MSQQAQTHVSESSWRLDLNRESTEGELRVAEASFFVSPMPLGFSFTGNFKPVSSKRTMLHTMSDPLAYRNSMLGFDEYRLSQPVMDAT